jgi:predicted nucleic-acid-binding Zn-ribbon protein
MTLRKIQAFAGPVLKMDHTRDAENGEYISIFLCKKCTYTAIY